MSKKRSSLSLDDDAVLMQRVDALAVEQGLPSLTPPPKSDDAAAPAALVAQEPPEPLKMTIPAYLSRDLAVRAAQRRVTKKYLVMEALRQAGYHIEDADMDEDGRRARGPKAK